MPVKEKIMNNFGWKLLAGIVAVIIWVIVINLDDPVDTRTFRNVTVEIKNEEAIASLDKVYEVQSGGIINVKASAKQSVLRKLTASDIVAVADLSNLSLTNAVSIQLSCPKYDNVTLTADTSMLRIALEDEKTAQFKVDVKTIGTPLDGFAIGEIKVRPNLIKVTGAHSLIERISEVRVELDVSNMTESFKKRLQPQVYDANGKLMDTERLSFSTQEILVSIEVNETKNIPIKISTTGQLPEGYHVISIEYEPKEVLVTGKEVDLDKINSLNMEIDVTNRDTDVETELILSEYLPQGVTVVGAITSVNVKLTISKQTPQTVRLPLENIQVENLDEKYELHFDKADGWVEIKVILTDTNEYRAILPSEIASYIDCTDLKEGKHEVELKFEENTNFLILSEITLDIVLKEKIATSLEEDTKPGELPKVEPTFVPTATWEPQTSVPTVEEETETENYQEQEEIPEQEEEKEEEEEQEEEKAD